MTIDLMTTQEGEEAGLVGSLPPAKVRRTECHRTHSLDPLNSQFQSLDALLVGIRKDEDVGETFSLL